jgi:hypothetical protein
VVLAEVLHSTFSISCRLPVGGLVSCDEQASALLVERLYRWPRTSAVVGHMLIASPLKDNRASFRVCWSLLSEL